MLHNTSLLAAVARLSHSMAWPLFAVSTLATRHFARPKIQLPYPDRTSPGPPCEDCPNIVFALTDDQDITLGGWTTPMRQTQTLIEAEGTMLTRWTIHTPICSPSRSETVSGRYFHNIKSDVAVPPPKVLPAASAHVNGTLYANQSFGVYLRRDAGYQVGMFGKANFNTYEGFDRWFQGAWVGYGSWWEDDECPSSGEEQCKQPGKYHARDDEYATALIGNKTVEWLRRPSVGASARPWFAYFAPHCPHTPATPADWYSDACGGVLLNGAWNLGRSRSTLASATLTPSAADRSSRRARPATTTRTPPSTTSSRSSRR